MSKYLVNKFLYTIDRDPDLVERYREDPRGTVGWWEAERANLILRDKVRAFRADPEVRRALAAAQVDRLAVPTLADGETWRDIVDFAPDTDALGERGMAFEQLDQLALEYLYGVR